MTSFAFECRKAENKQEKNKLQVSFTILFTRKEVLQGCYFCYCSFAIWVYYVWVVGKISHELQDGCFMKQKIIIGCKSATD